MDQPAPDLASEPDDVLLMRFAAGERAALEALARRHENALLGLARGLLDGRADAACDAVQETWLRVIRYARSFRRQSSFKTWVYRIMINQCHNIRSRRQPAALSANGVLEDRPARAAPAGESTEDCERLRREVAQLKPEHRLILLLCYHDGMSHQQAAEILEIPVGTLKSRLHAALTELRQRMPSEVPT
jgi:RNA polymerase sigma-70 factor, ECF subfamily